MLFLLPVSTWLHETEVASFFISAFQLCTRRCSTRLLLLLFFFLIGLLRLLLFVIVIRRSWAKHLANDEKVIADPIVKLFSRANKKEKNLICPQLKHHECNNSLNYC